MEIRMIGSLPFTIGKVYGRKKDRYLELIQQFPLRRIRNDEELDVATKVIHSLIDIDQDKLTPAENDYLDVISDLVEAYEEVTIPMGDGPDCNTLEFLMDIQEIKQAQLSRDTGIATSTISEVLSGKRKLTRKQIEKLSAYFKVSPAVFHTTIS